MYIVVNGNIRSTSTLAAEKVFVDSDSIADQLNRYLGPEFISYRSAEGGKKVAYAEGHVVIGLLNTIFGWDGWNSRVVSFATDHATSDNGGKWCIGLFATVRLTFYVKDGDKTREVCREDIGYGTIENGSGRGKSMEKCRKEAVTDGIKRAARQLGLATGGCLYDKEYLRRIKSVRGPAERIEFEEDDLFRMRINKRKRFALAQEKRQQVVCGESHKSEYGDSDDDMFAQIPESEELVM